MVEDSYLARVGQHDAVWRSVEPQVPAALREAATECVFIMLKPDALVEGKHAALLKAMASAGWQLVHAQATLTAGAEHFESLYQYNLTVRNEQNMVGAWWLNARVYTMAPSVALLYRVPPDRSRGITSHQVVKKRKGSSDPFVGRAGELRWEVGGTNMALNLLHASDDPLSTLREFLLFGSGAQLRSALRRVCSLRAGTAEPPGQNGWSPGDEVDEAVESAGTGNRRLCLPIVLSHVKGRFRITDPCPALRPATTGVYRRYRELARRPLDPRARWLAFCALAEDERRIIDDLRCPTGCVPHPIMRILALPTEFTFETAHRIKVECVRRRLPLDSWDELALDTSLYYHALLPFPSEVGQCAV